MTTCLDSGPWPCAEAGCPSPTIGCALLAQDGVCGKLFKAVWKTPPDGLGEVKIADQCRLSCDRCTVVEHYQQWCVDIDGCFAINKEYDDLDYSLSVGLADLPIHAPKLRRSIVALERAEVLEGNVQVGVLHNDSRALELAQGMRATWPTEPNAVTAVAVGLARKGDEAAVEVFAEAAKLRPLTLSRYAAARPGNFEALSGTLGGGAPAEAAAGGAAAADDDGGGWGGGACPATCAFDVRGAELTLEKFEETYVRGGRPVVLPLAAVVGAPEDDASTWRRDELLAAHGDVVVPVGWTAESMGRQKVYQTVAADGSVTVGAAKNQQWEEMSLRTFVEAHMMPTAPTAAAEEAGGAPANATGSSVDSADARLLLASKALPELLAAAAAAPEGPLLASAEFMLGGGGTDWLSRLPRMLSLGPAGSGHYYRAHVNAFFALRHGCVRHVLLPPAAAFRKTMQVVLPPPHPPRDHALHGLVHVPHLTPHPTPLPSLHPSPQNSPHTRPTHHTPTHRMQERARRAGVDAWLADARDPHYSPLAPLECVARGGSAVFVPSGWKHMIVHEQHSVGLVLEVGDKQLNADFTESLDAMEEAKKSPGKPRPKPVEASARPPRP